MLCSMVVNGVLSAMKSLAWSAGQEYRTLVVSFDPRDTVAAASAKRATYVASYGRSVTPRAFDFDVGEKGEVSRLAAALGFHYRWDEETKQFAHAAGAFVVTPDGRISRTLFGLTFPDLRLALLEPRRDAWEPRSSDSSSSVITTTPRPRDTYSRRRGSSSGGRRDGAGHGAAWLMSFWRAEARKARGEVTVAAVGSPGRETGSVPEVSEATHGTQQGPQVDVPVATGVAQTSPSDGREAGRT